MIKYIGFDEDRSKFYFHVERGHPQTLPLNYVSEHEVREYIQNCKEQIEIAQRYLITLETRPATPLLTKKVNIINYW